MLKSLRPLFPYIRPHWKLLAAAFFLAIPLAAIRSAPAPLVKYFVDGLMIGKDAKLVFQIPILFVSIFLANMVVRFLHYFCIRVVTIKINYRLKLDLYNHLMGLSSDYFSHHRVGQLISRVGNDPVFIDGGVSGINIIIREPVTFLMLFGYALWIDWRLTLIVLLVLPFLGYIFHATGKNLKRYTGRLSEENATLFSTLQESLVGFRIVQAFGLERYVKRRFRRTLDSYAKYCIKSSAMEEIAHPLVELITALALAGVLYFGGRTVLKAEMSPGDLSGFFMAFGMMINPLRLLNDVNIKLSQAAGAADRIFEILSWKSHLSQPTLAHEVKDILREIKFEHVAFAYPDEPNRMILKDLTLTVPKGSVIAIVGESGAGKTSILQLIPRLFDVTSGRITLDGVDVRDLDLYSLRKMVAIVSQDIFLFNDTIEENIRSGRLGASRDDIVQASKHAHADNFIERFPKGYQTIVGDRGQKLSGGEKQRISIARAFLRNSPILILDEATSNLDSESERMVQNALEELMQDRTTLIVAHRLSTVQKADHIFVLKEGRIVEAGTHDDLIDREGEYSRFKKHLQI